MNKRILAVAIFVGAILALLVALNTLVGSDDVVDAEQSKPWPTEDGRYLRENRIESGQWRVSYAIVRGGKVSVEHGLIEGLDSISEPVKAVTDAIYAPAYRFVKSDRCGKLVFYPVGNEFHAVQKDVIRPKRDCTIRDATGKWKMLPS